MIRKIIYICLLTCFSISTLLAQKEANKWVFGQKGGLDFNTLTRSHGALKLTDDRTVYTTATVYNLPAVIPAAKFPTSDYISTYEGCFSLADSDGNLLFYSDGVSLWKESPGNNSHTKVVVSNLGGSPSSAQSGVLMPRPGYPGQYIILALSRNIAYDPAVESPPGIDKGRLHYTIVDTDGTIIQNTTLLSESSVSSTTSGTGQLGESMNVVRHKNNKDFWIVAVGKGSTTVMNAWLVTDQGIQTTPVQTRLPFSTNQEARMNGYLKFSPNGNHFAWAETELSTAPPPVYDGLGNRLFVGNFNSGDGTFSDVKAMVMSQPVLGPSCYGLEFSPSGSYLYVTYASAIGVFNFQTLLGGMATALRKFCVPNDTSSGLDKGKDQGNSAFGALQLAPDGRIYCAMRNANYPYPNAIDFGIKSYLTVIENVENPTTVQAYRLNTGFLVGGSHHGLPSFSASWFGLSLDGPTEVCLGDAATYTVQMTGTGTDRIRRVQWDMGDGLGFSRTDTDNSSSGVVTKSQSVTFATSGNKTIKIRAYNAITGGTLMDERELTVTVLPIPTVVSASGTPSGGNVTLTATVSSGATAAWYAADGTTYLGSSASGVGFSTTLPSGSSVSFKVKAKNSMCESAFTTVNVTVGNNFIRVNPHLKSGF